MPRSKPDSENVLEQAAIALFADIGWRTVDAMYESYGPQGTLGRASHAEVVLVRELPAALEQLNLGLPSLALDAAIEALISDRSVLGMVQANRELYGLLKNGVNITYQGADGEQISEMVRVVDWAAPANNRYDEATFANAQIWKNLLRRTCTTQLWQGKSQGINVEVWGNSADA